MKLSPLSPMIQNTNMDYEPLSDDENSTSSTVMVSPVKKSRKHATSVKSTTRKSVSFNHYANQQIESTLVLESRDIAELWWSHADLRSFREDKHYALKEIHHFDQAQEHAARHRQTFLSVMHRVFEACCEVRSECDRDCVTQNDLQRFQLYIHSMDYRHGLERSTSDMLSNDKMGRRHYLNETVLQLQREWRHHLTADILAEFLRDASQNISRPSRLFARRLATAHAFMPNQHHYHP
mmetsp:Transcript_7293/g.15195  ORF Transcript_7293/g.15195 Transcript_7293/m.15195 type:complete len:237 (-) Transcript_7293:109-819(-)